MTPEVLKQYLEVMRSSSLMSIHFKMDGVEIAATFSPEMEPSALSVDAEGKPLENEPGAWKTWRSGPQGLDLPFVEEVKED